MGFVHLCCELKIQVSTCTILWKVPFFGSSHMRLLKHHLCHSWKIWRTES